MDLSATALQLHDLAKSYGRIRAVDGLSLEVRAGEIVGFLGPNGAGKSTTLSMITGLVRPSSGTIELFGHNVHTHFKEAMQSVGAMVERPAFYEYLSARKNLELIGRLRGGVTREQINSALRHVGLFERRSDKVAVYSQGMRQRLGLASALLGSPRLLLLDEPTNGLDPEATREILSFLRTRVRADGMAVFLSSHLLAEIEEYCDRVVIINKGQLIASGTVREILSGYDHIVRVAFHGARPDPSAFMPQDGIASVEALNSDTLQVTLADRDSAWLNRFLLDRHYQVSALVPGQRTLRDYFLSITGDRPHGSNDNSPAA